MADAPPNLPIPDWLAARLRSAGGGLSPRYEASLYGPLNSFLTWYFPPTRQFMIKPQGKIRPHYSSDIADDVDMVRVSIDSYGGEVLSRDEKGGEQSVKIPDFVVVKASASLHGDRVLMIVEVKRGDMSLDAAKEQLAEYFGSFADKVGFDGQPLFDHLEGLVVVGKYIVMASLPTPGGLLEFSPLRDITGNIVHDFVRGIAVANW
jgi:hypothetical protein